MNLKKILDSIDVEPIMDMARFSQEDSGLRCWMWLAPNLGNNTGQHNQPRMKFQNNTANKLQPEYLVPISIDKENPQVLVDYDTTKLGAKEINRIKQWIIKNYDVLMEYYNNNITEIMLGKRIKKI